MRRRFLSSVLVPALLFCPAAEAKSKKASRPYLTAQSYALVDARSGSFLHGRAPNKRLPPASTAKVMTVLVALETLPPGRPVTVGRNAVNVSPSKAGLTPGERYRAIDLVKACLVASSNDAAVALAEAVSGGEREFAARMNARAKELGMADTRFVNATGLSDKKQKQYTTALDLTKLMRAAIKDRRIDEMMGLIETTIRGSDGKVLILRAHNKMLWRAPKLVKGKTGWTHASRHTFVGTDYVKRKSIAFAMLSSERPWTDIERLAAFGAVLSRRR